MRPAFCFPFALVLILLTTAAGTGGQPSPGEPSEDELPSGLKALHSDDPQVRYNAVCLLQKFGKTARFALPELYKMLNDPELPVRLKVVETLWQLEPKQADKLVPVLVEVLQQKDPVLRGRALAVLSQLGAKAKAALPAIKSALRDADFNVQLQAILAAAAIGPAAADVMPELLTILRTDDTGFLQGSVAIALSSMGPRVVPALRTAVQDKNERVRRGSAYALGLLGTKGYLAVPELTTALMDEDALVRVYAVQALGKMQRYAADAASAVQKLLHDADAEVRVQAALALWRIHEDAAGLAVLRRELSEAAEALVR